MSSIEEIRDVITSFAENVTLRVDSDGDLQCKSTDGDWAYLITWDLAKAILEEVGTSEPMFSAEELSLISDCLKHLGHATLAARVDRQRLLR